MILKCPKCRFSFEEDVSVYVNELSCVCPRCGTPFTFSRPTFETSDPESDQPTGTLATPSNPEPPFRKTEIAHRQIPQNDERNHTTEHTQSFHPSERRHQHHKNQGNDKYFFRLVAALICSLAVVVVVVVFGLSKILDSKNVRPTLDETSPAYENLVDTAELTIEDIDHLQPETAPQWVYGTWKGRTRYFEISLKIGYDGKIEETVDNRSVQGAYLMNDHRLVCRFPENTTMVYRIDENTHTIDAGNGIKLNKE